MSEIKEVVLVRRKITNQMINLRSFVSCIPGNEAVVDRMRGQAGEVFLAEVVAFIEAKLRGQQTVPSVEAPTSQVRRAVQKSFAKPRAEGAGVE